ncbi:hypothetical protein GGR56DRAFT_244226 [Xylariaceae sp. FL0804]|nr:hypothetical protein GGR56DRAFT_244226 [Xylariaceae sp. FL0804]
MLLALCVAQRTRLFALGGGPVDAAPWRLLPTLLRRQRNFNTIGKPRSTQPWHLRWKLSEDSWAVLTFLCRLAQLIPGSAKPAPPCLASTKSRRGTYYRPFHWPPYIVIRAATALLWVMLGIAALITQLLLFIGPKPHS